MQTTLLLVLAVAVAVAVAVVHAAPQQEQVPNPDAPTLRERRSPVAQDDKAKDAGQKGGSEAQGGAQQGGDKTTGEADNAKGTAAFRPAREVLVAQEPENPPKSPPPTA